MPTVSAGRERVRKLLADATVPALLRGEVWIQPAVLRAAGFIGGPVGMVDFAVSIGGDLCFFPLTAVGDGPSLRDLSCLAHDAGLASGAIVDGPFQRLAGQGDLLERLAGTVRDPEGFAADLGRQMEEVRRAVDGAAGAGVDLLLLTDDLAHAGGLYFATSLIRRSLIPGYRDLIGRFSAEGLHWGWHSDGRVTEILPDLVGAGFRFFSLEAECVDLAAFKRTYREQICLGGIRAEWLTAETFAPGLRLACAGELGALRRAGGTILASSCGIHDPRFLPNLREIYRLIENMRDVGNPCAATQGPSEPSAR